MNSPITTGALRRRQAVIALGAFCVIGLSGCVAEGGVHEPNGPVYHPAPPRHPAEAIEIPPGHRPPPGECRIWFPDRPPGEQPPPGPCRELQFQIPPGAVLVRG